MSFKIKEFKREKFSHLRIHSGIISMLNNLDRSELQTLIVLSYLNDWKDGKEQANFNYNQLANAFNLNSKSIKKSIERLDELNIINNNNGILTLNINGLNSKLDELKEMTKKIVPTKDAIKKQLQMKEIEAANDVIELTEQLIAAGITLTTAHTEKYKNAKQLINDSSYAMDQEQQIEAFEAEISTSFEELNTTIHQEEEKPEIAVETKQIEATQPKVINLQSNYRPDATNEHFQNILQIIRNKHQESELKDKLTTNQFTALFFAIFAQTYDIKLDAMIGTGNISKAVSNICDKFHANFLDKVIDSNIERDWNEITTMKMIQILENKYGELINYSAAA